MTIDERATRDRKFIVKLIQAEAVAIINLNTRVEFSNKNFVYESLCLCIGLIDSSRILPESFDREFNRWIRNFSLSFLGFLS